MSVLLEARGLARFAFAARRFVRQPLTAANAKEHVRAAVARRDDAFLRLVEDTVFACPTSPYLTLLRAAGCELGDVREMVRRSGVEDALRSLRQSGVYVSFEELKGRTPARRGSQTFHFSATDFDNPRSDTHFRGQTGGTRGPSSTVRFNLDHIAQTAPHWAVWFAAHQWEGRPLALWTSVHAAVANGLLRYAKLGVPFLRWFAMGGGGTWRDQATAAALHRSLRWAVGTPAPEPVALDDPRPIADYLVALGRDDIKPLFNTSTSGAVRLSHAARERGSRLDHVTFLLRGEPLTAARRAAIEASGARAVQTYGFAEGGTVGSQCPTPSNADDIHIYRDAFVALSSSDTDAAEPSSLLLTSLRPACPKVLLNAEIGDHAVLETRSCGCLLDHLGYSQHMHTVRSSQKLSGEGVTILGADIFGLLENVLPARFGGAVTDYQLVEEQAATGLARYCLYVSPAVGACDDRVVADVFLDELSRLNQAYRLMTRIWRDADLLVVKREAPRPSVRGKIVPFRTMNGC